MSYTYTAVAVVGCKIAKDRVFRDVDVRRCTHDLPSAEAKFCPECGKEAWELETKLRGCFLYANEHDVTIGGVAVTYDEYNDFVLVGEAIEVLSDYDPCVKSITTDPDEIKKRVKAALELDGLWDETSFGVWLSIH